MKHRINRNVVVEVEVELSDVNGMFLTFSLFFTPHQPRKMGLKSTSLTALRLRSHLEAEEKVNS